MKQLNAVAQGFTGRVSLFAFDVEGEGFRAKICGAPYQIHAFTLWNSVGRIQA